MDKTNMNDDTFSCKTDTRIPWIPECLREYGFYIFRCHAAKALDPGLSAGRNLYENCPLRKFGFYSVSHFVAGSGKVSINHAPARIMKPGDMILVSPGTLNRYGGIHDIPYLEDTICFAGPVADHMKRAGIISDGIFPLGKIRKLLPIIKQAEDLSLASRFSASMRMQQLLMEIYLASDSAKKPRSSMLFENLIKVIADYPERWWSVPELADMCHVTPTHLRRLFLRKTGFSPKHYIDQMKIRIAADLLCDGNGTVAAVARRLGFLDPYHFSRRFKEIMGVSPRDYRKSR